MGGIEWGEDGPTEQRAYEVLGRIFEIAEGRYARHERPDWLAPSARSPLAADDRVLHPWAASHSAIQAIVSGNDHLMTLAHLLAGPRGRFPAYAAFTIARAAIEAGAIALWAVGPDDPAERRINVLRWEYKSKLDLVSFGGRLGRRPKEDQSQDLDQATKRLWSLADELEIPKRRVKERLSTTAMLTAAHIPDGELPAVAAWSAASAFAHGSSWPTLLLQQVAWLPTDRPGEARAKVSADARILAWFALTAEELLGHAERLTRMRGRSPRPARAAMTLAFHQSPTGHQEPSQSS